MSRISVAEIARVIAKKHKMTIRESEKFVTAFIDVINNGLRYEKQVKIKGLGTFKVIDTKNRKSVNIKTGEAIVIEGRGKITFTPDAVMRDLVNKPFSQFETVELNDGVNFEDIEQVFATGKEDDAIAYEALFAADVVQSEEPESVLTTKPEIVDELEPVEETDEEPELIETPETEPIAVPEPEPEEEPKSESDDFLESEIIETPQIEPIAVPDPEPEEEPNSESDDSPESELIEASETESIAVPEPEPEELPKSESDDSPEPEFIETPEIEPIAVAESEEEPKPESDEFPKSGLIEASGTESIAVPEPEEEHESEEAPEPTRETAEKETADEELLEVEPVGESRVNTHIFEDRKASLLQHYRDYSEELEYQLDRQKNYRKWFALISCLLIVAACVGGYYAGSKIMKDKLDEQYQSMLVDNVSPDSISSMMEQEAKADSSAKAARLAKLREETDLRMKARQQSTQTNTAYETARERAKEITTIKSEQERAEKERFEADLKAKAQAREQKLKAEAEAKKQAQAKKLAEAEAAAQKAAAQKAAAQKAAAPKTATAKPSPQPAKAQPNAGKVIPVSPSKYEQMSAAVRLGAYRIVGIDQTITVRKGQTLKSISKAYFGPGMECYVEALNGGIKEVSEGQKLKIPKLELKKKGNK